MRWVKLASLLLMGQFYTFAGLNHFRNPDFYLRMMPPYIPAHEAMVFLSGVAEVGLGVTLLVAFLVESGVARLLLPTLFPNGEVYVARVRAYAAGGVIALLIAVFPANVYMATDHITIGNAPSWALWARLPLQGVLIAWAWWHTRDASAPQSADSRVAA